jgi:hypothetical protein
MPSIPQAFFNFSAFIIFCRSLGLTLSGGLSSTVSSRAWTLASTRGWQCVTLPVFIFLENVGVWRIQEHCCFSHSTLAGSATATDLLTAQELHKPCFKGITNTLP